MIMLHLYPPVAGALHTEEDECTHFECTTLFLIPVSFSTVAKWEQEQDGWLRGEKTIIVKDKDKDKDNKKDNKKNKKKDKKKNKDKEKENKRGKRQLKENRKDKDKDKEQDKEKNKDKD